MAQLFLGISAGLFMYAFVNHKYNASKWIKSKYIVWMGIAAFGISLMLF